MKYDDLLNVPYKPHGRDPLTGLDCYGLVVECCRRAGTPLRDPYYESDTVPIGFVNDYISEGLNVREYSEPRKGCVVLMEYGREIHTGYMVERGLVIHATRKHGVKISPSAILQIKKYYEVINESQPIQRAQQ